MLVPIHRFHLLPWRATGKHMPRHRDLGSRTRERGTQGVPPRLPNALLPLWPAVSGRGNDPGFRGRQIFRSPLPCKALELGGSVQAQLVLDLFAVRLDGFAAKMELLSNFPRTIRGA